MIILLFYIFSIDDECFELNHALRSSDLGKDTKSIEKNRKLLASVQRRSSLKIAYAYQTVFEAAVWVETHLGCLVSWRGPLTDIRTLECEELLVLWQGRWASALTRRWTFRLIGQVNALIFRKHGEVDDDLIQFLDIASSMSTCIEWSSVYVIYIEIL